MKKEEALQLLIANIPYPEQIKDYDLNHTGVIRFTWRDIRLQFDYDNLSVERVEDGYQSTDALCIVMRELLKKAYIKKQFEGN